MTQGNKRVRIIVEMDSPPGYGASAQGIREYVSDAIQTHGGSLPPDHPFFDVKGLNPSVTVERRHKPRQASLRQLAPSGAPT